MRRQISLIFPKLKKALELLNSVMTGTVSEGNEVLIRLSAFLGRISRFSVDDWISDLRYLIRRCPSVATNVVLSL
ncbi:hypothetical protein D9M68_982180 [compost metagenome]